MPNKTIPVAEFVDEGFLQEVNRLFFHPRGLALMVIAESSGSMEIRGILDYREDPEGIVFADGLLSSNEAADKAQSVEQERLRHVAPRRAMLGSVIQPVR